MTEDVVVEEHGEAANTLYGREVTYTIDGEEVMIKGFILEDEGVYWEFHRRGRMYPLRLGKQGMDMMIRLWHDLMWNPPSEKDIAVAQANRGGVK